MARTTTKMPLENGNVNEPLTIHFHLLATFSHTAFGGGRAGTSQLLTKTVLSPNLLNS